MDIRRGIAVSPGVAIGPALVLDTEGVVISRRSIRPGQEDVETARLGDALAAAAAAARRRERQLTEKLGDNLGVLGGHAILYEDPSLRRDVEALIRQNRFSAEYAFSRYVRTFVKRFDDLPANHEFVRLRADFLDLEKQVLNRLLGLAVDNSIPLAGEPVVVLAHDLSPSETAQLDPRSVHGFATESGGPTSHAAIMAGALEIPAVVGLGRFLHEIASGDLVVVDGTQGLLILEPDAPTVARYENLSRLQSAAPPTPPEPETHAEPVTRDGARVSLMGNIEFPYEAAHCVERGADGVGLYRTEFLYANKTSDPTEEEHFSAYRTALNLLGPERPMVIRTLDLGADKFAAVSDMLTVERNPFLGMRSVRLCLKNLPLFKTQLRAILRASVHGDVRVMFPMVSTVMELRQCKALLAEVQEDLEEEGIPFRRGIRVGTMIEVPSAALIADILAREVDFFSIGTNDLVQYTLAADRNNENVASLYNPADPAVLRLIKMVVDAANAEEIEVTVCGEMSGEPKFTPLLVGLGIRRLSATPRKLPDIRRVIRHLRVADANRIAAEALRMETAREVTTYLREQQRRIFPDLAD